MKMISRRYNAKKDPGKKKKERDKSSPSSLPLVLAAAVLLGRCGSLDEGGSSLIPRWYAGRMGRNGPRSPEARRCAEEAVPLALWRIRQAHTVVVKPLARAVFVVAGHHLFKRFEANVSPTRDRCASRPRKQFNSHRRTTPDCSSSTAAHLDQWPCPAP